MAPGSLELFQFAYFVADLAEAADRWARTLGAGPFFHTPHHRTERFDYRGQPIEADVSYAFGYSGPTQIQLIEQHDDQPSIYLDMFPNGAVAALHHVAALVPDYPAARQQLRDQGHEMVCELEANGIIASYFDTRSTIGCFTEIHSITDRIIDTFSGWHTAHEQWDGSGPALRDRT